ncbi:hypothetical protein ACIPRU_13095 [Streptomyces sp. NPDC090126]
MVLNGRVYDASSPKGGESILENKAQREYSEIINFDFQGKES